MSIPEEDADAEAKEKETADKKLKKDLEEYSNKLFDALGITPVAKNALNKAISEYGDTEKNKLVEHLKEITNTNKISKAYDKLIEADKQLKNLGDKNDFMNKTYSSEWNVLLGNLGELQGLILIKKAEKGCDDLIKELIKAFDNKIKAVNEFMKVDLENKNAEMVGGSNNNLHYKTKYLKYKSKYLNLIKK